jgi:cell wall-associated NlpC family hydrolase
MNTRDKIIKVAYSWLGTPYHSGGSVKGVGIDCLTLLSEVYKEAGIIDNIEIPFYPNDWHLHKNNERYLEGLLQHAKEVQTPQKGDIIIWQFGRCYSHGAIIVDYPLIIHAYTGRQCTLEDAEKASWVKYIGGNNKLRPVKFFSVF